VINKQQTRARALALPLSSFRRSCALIFFSRSSRTLRRSSRAVERAKGGGRREKFVGVQRSPCSATVGDQQTFADAQSRTAPYVAALYLEFLTRAYRRGGWGGRRGGASRAQLVRGARGTTGGLTRARRSGKLTQLRVSNDITVLRPRLRKPSPFLSLSRSPPFCRSCIFM